MKHLYLLVIILVCMIVFCIDHVLAQPSSDRVKEILPEQIHHLRAEVVHGLVVLDREHVLITVSVRGDGGVLRDRVLKITLRAGDDGGYAIEESRFGSIPYKGVGGIAISTDGKMVLVCDTVASRIYELDAKTGKLWGAIDTAGEVIDLAVVGDGSLWYLTTDGRLHHYYQDGRTKIILNSETRKPVMVNGATGLAMLPASGEVVVSCGDEVVVVNPDNGMERVLAKGFLSAVGICAVMLDGEESYFVADDGAGKIFLLKMDGSKRVIFDGVEDGDEGTGGVGRAVGLLDEKRFIVAGSVGGDDGREVVLVIDKLDK